MQKQGISLRKVKKTLKWFAYKAIMAYWARKIDVYVVGYPKTGNTWLSFVLRRMLVKHYGLSDEEFSKVIFHSLWKWQCWRELPPEVPVIHTTHNMPGYWSGTRDEITLYMTPFKGKKVILLIRDPKDTLVSLYFHNVYRRIPPLFEGNMIEMIHDRTYGIKNYLHYYRTWYEYRTLPAELLLVRYEDHHADPAKVVRDTARFIGINNLAESTVEDVVSFCNFENMKNMEKKNTVLGLSRSVPPPENGFKARKGKIGGFKEYLNEDMIRYIDDLVAKELPAFYRYNE